MHKAAERLLICLFQGDFARRHSGAPGACTKLSRLETRIHAGRGRERRRWRECRRAGRLGWGGGGKTKGRNEERDGVSLKGVCYAISRVAVGKVGSREVYEARRRKSLQGSEGRSGGCGAGKRGSRMTPWPGTYEAPRLLGPRLLTPSFYQKANPEEAKSPVPLSSRFSFVHLSPLAFSQPILILLLIPPPPSPPPPPPAYPPLPTRPLLLLLPRVTLYLLPLVGSGACPYRVCYYYLTLSIIPKRAGSPLRDCDSPRD